MQIYRCSLFALIALIGSGLSSLRAADALPEWTVAWQGVETHRYEEYTVTHAANELATTMSKVLGTGVVTSAWERAQGKNILYLTDEDHAPAEFREALAGKHRDAFVIRYPYELDGKKVCILVTRDSYAHDFSAYYFLTTFMDVHWVGPGELGEVIRRQPDWTFPESIDVLEDPHYEHRFWNIGSFRGRKWLGRSMRMSWHHALGHVFDPKKYGQTDPEVYPLLKNGKRFIPDLSGDATHSAGWQPCTSHPRSIEIATQYVLDDLKKNPYRISSSLSLNDGAGNICHCQLCLALDEPDAFVPGRRPDLSDRIFTFYNRVMENVLKENPEAYIAVIQYGVAAKPPRRVKIHPRIQIFHVVPTIEHLCEWAPTGAGVNMHEWLYDSGFLQIRPDVRMIAEILRVGHTMGGVGFYSEVIPHWPSCGPRFYVLSHLLWNTDQSEEDLFREYLDLTYGEAAADGVYAYYRRWDEIFNRQPTAWQYHPIYTWRRIQQFTYFRRDDFTAMQASLDQASASPMNEKQKQRLAYLLTYHKWLAINAEQYLLARELADPAWVSGKSFDELAAIIVPSLSLSEQFDRVWKEEIAADTTGWLIDKHSKRRVDHIWDRFNAQMRALVASAHDTAIDTAINHFAKREVDAKGKDGAIASLQALSTKYADLAPFIGPQVNALKGIEPIEIIQNGGFEKGSPHPTNPKVDGWLDYQAFGMMKATSNNYRWEKGAGRDGGYAYGQGDGDYAELRTGFKMDQGSRYRLSFWYKTENRENLPVTFWIFSHKGEIENLATIKAKGTIARFMMYKLQPTAGEWEYFTCTFSPAKGGSFIMQPAAGRQKPGQWTWFDDISIKKLW